MPYDVTFAGSSIPGILKWHEEMPSRVTPEVFPRRHGSVVQEIAFLGPRTVTISGLVASSSEANLTSYLDGIGRTLTEAGKDKLILRTTSRYLNAIKAGYGFEFNTGEAPDVIAKYTMEFIADDPFWYSPLERIEERPTTTASLTTFSVVNSGGVKTPPRVEFQASSGSVVNVKLTNTTIGLAMQFSGTITNLQTCSIDSAKSQVQNGGANGLNNFVGSFFLLEPGTNNLQYDGPTGVTVNIHWTERWA